MKICEFEVPAPDGPHSYRFSYIWQDMGWVNDGVISTEIAVVRINADGHEDASITATVAVDVNNNQIIVTLPDDTELVVDLRDYKLADVDHRADGLMPGDEGELDGYWNTIVEASSANAEAVAAAIDAIPVPDPLIGCVLRAGIATVVGQAVACNEQVGGGGELYARVRAVLGCLRGNGLRILGRTTTRTLRCMVMGGLPACIPWP
ncbi:hypothetical protein [Maricaulis salignorans]|uniref:hypothetical protein n=1 Tax=Maricaulis salignorans TaxID=144026 RepID=UPI003A90C387